VEIRSCWPTWVFGSVVQLSQYTKPTLTDRDLSIYKEEIRAEYAKSLMQKAICWFGKALPSWVTLPKPRLLKYDMNNVWNVFLALAISLVLQIMMLSFLLFLHNCLLM